MDMNSRQVTGNFKNGAPMTTQVGAYNTYIGPRIVPEFVGDWDNTVNYEPLTVVNYNGTSYTSRQYVPAGILPTNTTYWAPSGNFNGQLESLREEVINNTISINEINNKLNTIGSFTSAVELGCDNTGKTDCSSIINEYLSQPYNTLYFPAGEYLILNPISSLHMGIFMSSNAKIIAGASMDSMFIFNNQDVTSINQWIYEGYFYGGVLDCNNNASYGVKCNYMHTSYFNNITILNPRTCGFYIGSSMSGVNSKTASLVINLITVSCSAISTVIGFEDLSGDNCFMNCATINCLIGFKTVGWDRYFNCHPWNSDTNNQNTTGFVIESVVKMDSCDIGDCQTAINMVSNSPCLMAVNLRIYASLNSNISYTVFNIMAAFRLMVENLRLEYTTSQTITFVPNSYFGPAFAEYYFIHNVSGYSNIENIINILGTNLNKGFLIPSNFNINNIIFPTLYYCISGNTTTNVPDDSYNTNGYSLNITKNGLGLLVTITQYDVPTFKQHIRCRTSDGGYTPWVAVTP